MPKITKDIDGILSLEDKKALLKEMKQEELLTLFKKNYNSTYKPIKQKKVALDQQVSIAITTEEKEILLAEMAEIKKTGGKVTLSSVMRSRVMVDIDLIEWRGRASEGLKELNGPNWNKRAITRELEKYMKSYDNLPLDDMESRKIHTYKIADCNRKLKQLEKPNIKRSYKLKGRVTFNEANIIRWRAGRLNITVADYMRFMIFGYLPFSKDDKTLSVETRKRFYISILDVAHNGWGEPPQSESCPNCLRYIEEINELKEKIKRLQNFS